MGQRYKWVTGDSAHTLKLWGDQSEGQDQMCLFGRTRILNPEGLNSFEQIGLCTASGVTWLGCDAARPGSGGGSEMRPSTRFDALFVLMCDRERLKMMRRLLSGTGALFGYFNEAASKSGETVPLRTSGCRMRIECEESRELVDVTAQL
ncbi:hypothetical protein N7478_009221 [Penicillium angulare]|uniref:uncharacterized protein n=1 Tax=Penicillium angulare TaxID=116970 RepID=UPI00254039D1|nr:uncharacterized protein N7478_009221 [Penicillium angulare]KAJ5274096.1 hypothetical protein N7478_009221 [Penicillium angulare]